MVSIGRVAAVLAIGLAGHVAAAGEADVLEAKIARSPDGTYRISVTVQHGDTGWDHYADRWDVVGPDGTVLGSRILLHPHVNEQPFTRSLSGVAIPDGTEFVVIRAHDNVHGPGGAEFRAKLPQ
ncbi:MAG: hypothetical protein ACR2PM_15885 [Hyphomicrobiales bacterium]